METISLLKGIKIPNQNALDSKAICVSENILKNLGTENNLAYTYYDGLQVLCQLEKSEWEWREAQVGEVGLLTSNFIYPANLVVNNITYSLKPYNFFIPKTLVFNSNTANATIQVGGVTPNTVLANKTVKEILTQMLVVYQNPAFTAQAVTGQDAIVEIGTTISGNKTFTWSTSNAGNVKVNTVQIIDVTASNTVLSTGLANDGTESVAVATIKLDANHQTQVWSLKGTNTNEQVFQSSNIGTAAKYYTYFSSVATRPTNSAEVKALNKAFQITNNETFTLNTGTANLKFVIALPPDRTIASVIDLDALSANITSAYVLVGTINVVDAGGTTRVYNLYEYENALLYTTNHRHVITTN